jgi:hypothetical protein
MSSDSKRSISKEEVGQYWKEAAKMPKEERLLGAAERQMTREVVMAKSMELLREELGQDHEKIAGFATLCKDTLEHIADFFHERKVSHGNGLVVLEAVIHTVANQMAKQARAAETAMASGVATTTVQ